MNQESQSKTVMPALTVENLTVQISNATPTANAITDISFEVMPGETVCLVGESGSGKSVTSLATLGLLPKRELEVTSGRILLAEENILEASSSRLRALRAAEMAMIFQEPMT